MICFYELKFVKIVEPIKIVFAELRKKREQNRFSQTCYPVGFFFFFVFFRG